IIKTITGQEQPSLALVSALHKVILARLAAAKEGEIEERREKAIEYLCKFECGYSLDNQGRLYKLYKNRGEDKRMSEGPFGEAELIRICDREEEAYIRVAKQSGISSSAVKADSKPDKAGLEEDLYYSLTRILPEQSQYYPLSERRLVHSDGTEEPVERQRQTELSALGKRQTNRYSRFFEWDTAPREWPESNLKKDRIIAEWLDKLVSLEGKTIIHYRSEYYPFFGLEVVKYGATSYLVDSRRIPYAEDFILGRKRFSRQDYLKAQEAMRQVSPLSESVSKYAEELSKLPSVQLLELIVRVELRIPEYIWNSLEILEKNYYILKWIINNPAFNLAAAKYFGESWWSLSEEDRIPFLLKFLGENFSQVIRNDVHSTALSILRERSIGSLADGQKFAYYVGKIYGDIITEDKLFSSNEEVKKKIRENITFKHGKELANIELLPNSVDVIFSGYALNFIENTVDFSNGVQKLLKPGGLFVGYIKSGGDGTRKFCSEEELKTVLERMGFEKEDMVIAEGDWHGRDTEYLFFARKSLKAPLEFRPVKDRELPFIPDEKKLFLAFNGRHILEETQQIESVTQEDVVRDWQKDVTLFSLSEKFVALCRQDPQKVKNAVKCLYSLVFGKKKTVDENLVNCLLSNQVNIENLFRYAIIKYKDFAELKRAINVLSNQDLQFMLVDLEQFYLIRKQIKYLLTDLKGMFNNINLFLPVDILEQRILERAELIGGNQLLQAVQDILNVVIGSNIPWRDRNEALIDAQGAFINYLADYNYSFLAEYVIDAIFYSKYEYPFGPPENKAYDLKASIGELAQVSLINLNGVDYPVDKIYRSISKNKGIAGQFIDLGNGKKRYAVYIDTFEEALETIRREYSRHSIWGALVKKQWGNTEPARSKVMESRAKSTAFHEILHDLFPQLGEIPSYLMEIAYGPEPFVELFNRVAVLSEISKDGNFHYLINLLNPEARSSHYQASRLILTRYLKYAFKNNKIEIPGLRKRIKSVMVSNNDKYELSEIEVQDNRGAIIAALSLLSEEEVRGVAKDWLRNEYGFVVGSVPQELTVALPIPEEVFNKEGKDAFLLIDEKEKILRATVTPLEKDSSLPVLADNSTLPRIISNALDKLLPIQDSVEQTDLIIELAKSVASWNVDSAVNLINSSIRQDFLKAKALIELAISLKNMGNKVRSIRLLREAERILQPDTITTEDKTGLCSRMGAVYFFGNGILSLKQNLGLGKEIARTKEDLRNSLLPEGREIKNLNEKRVSLLVEFAVKSEDIILLNRIEKAIFEQNIFSQHLESNLRLRIQIGSAYAQISDIETAHKLLSLIMQEKIGWVNSEGILKAALALADIGFGQEALEKIEEMQRLKNIPNKVGVAEDYLYTASGKIKAKLGLINEARDDLSYALKVSKENRFEGDDWGILKVIDAQLETKDFLDDTLEAARTLHGYKNRVDVLIKIALANKKTGKLEAAESIFNQALRIAESIEEDSAREIIKFKIFTLKQDLPNQVIAASPIKNQDAGRVSETSYTAANQRHNGVRSQHLTEGRENSSSSMIRKSSVTESHATRPQVIEAACLE
ncbi:MAG: hypothetical protein DRJ64_04450, partial [Thermoprotei archaeon]